MTSALDMATRLIMQLEGFSPSPMPDTGTRWQIGYGCNFLPDGSAVTAYTPDVTLEQAGAMLEAMLAPLDAKIRTMVTAPMIDCEEAALCSFAWNEGVAALRGSHLLLFFNDGKVQEAADQFDAWVYAEGVINRGLKTRRALERSVFLGLVVP